MKVRRLNLSWIVFTVLLLSFALSLSAQDARVTVIRAGHLFDSKSGRLLADQTVLVRGDKIEVEPKSEMKKRMNRSPDLADWLAISVEGARRLGFQINRMESPVTGLDDDNRWREDLRQRQKRLEKSYQLEYAV